MSDLGTFGSDTSFAYDVGGRFACGEAATDDGSRHAFVTSGDGSLTWARWAVPIARRSIAAIRALDKLLGNRA
jgi:hypothetical protein